MNPFIRFVFVLVILGAAINLTIVLAGNRLGADKQRQMVAQERSRMARHYARLADTPADPAAHIAVESQELAGGQVLNTKLLVRQYRLNPEGKRVPLLTHRFVVPGDVLSVRAVAIAFRDDLPDYDFLRGKTLHIMSEVYTSLQVDPKSHARFFVPGEVPESVRDSDDQPSRLELALWRYVGEAVTAKRDDDLKKLESFPGVEMTTPQWPEERKLLQGSLFKFVINRDKGVALIPDADLGLLTDMLREANSPATQR